MSSNIVVGCGCAILGLVVGVFVTVVVRRVPRGESVLRSPSACLGCGQPTTVSDCIPVLSWILLRGRCRHCEESISVRYPLTEAGTAALFGLVGWFFGASWETPAFLYGATIALALALIDLDTHRLPDAIVLPSYPVVAILLMVAAWGNGDWPALLRALLGALALGLFYAVLWIAYPAGLGFGDVKLAPIVGAYLAWVGWGALIVGGFAAFLLGGLLAIGLLVLGRADRTTGIPFGPSMLLGGAIAIVVGQQLWDGYLGALD